MNDDKLIFLLFFCERNLKEVDDTKCYIPNDLF